MRAAADLAANTRARLIELAREDIRQIGPARLTVLGIARRLGMSHANVYRFFTDKHALVDAVLHGWLAGLEVRLGEIVDGPDPADDKLERFLTALSRAYAETQENDAQVFALLAQPGKASKEAVRHRRRVAELLGRVVEEGIATRLFSGNDARRLGLLVFDLAYKFVDPSAVLNAGGTSAQQRDRAMQAIIRVVSYRK